MFRTSHEETIREALMVSDKFVLMLVRKLEDAVAATYSQQDTGMLIAAIGILVNVAATPEGRDALIKPVDNRCSVCELVPMLLANPPNSSEDLSDILLNLLNNLAFEPKGATLLLDSKVLPALSGLLHSDRTGNDIKNYTVQIISGKLLSSVPRSSYKANKKVSFRISHSKHKLLYELLQELHENVAIRPSVMVLYEEFLRVFGEE